MIYVNGEDKESITNIYPTNMQIEYKCVVDFHYCRVNDFRNN